MKSKELRITFSQDDLYKAVLNYFGENSVDEDSPEKVILMVKAIAIHAYGMATKRYYSPGDVDASSTPPTYHPQYTTGVTAGAPNSMQGGGAGAAAAAAPRAPEAPATMQRPANG